MDETEIHYLVGRLKDLANQLGKTPTREEFYNSGVSDWKIKKVGYLKLLQLAGMESSKTQRSPEKLTNEIFERDLESVLSQYKARNPSINPIKSTVLAIPDIHFPFHSQHVLDSIYKFAQKHRPKVIIQLGDLYDLYAHSKFPRSQNIYSPVQEEDMARRAAEDMWEILKNECPTSKMVQIKGNHDIRPTRRTLEKQPEVEHIVSRHVDGLMTFDGVDLISDYREEFIQDEVLYHHGYRTKLGDHRDYVLRNMVVGHTHRGGVVYRRLRDQTLWELNAGFAGDPDAKVFGYMPQKTTDYTLGFGFIDEYGPRFIPL